jgi:hypothetical protein
MNQDRQPGVGLLSGSSRLTTIESIRRRKAMAMKESGNRRHKWLATPLMLTLMAGISSIALAQEERSGSPESTDGVPLSALNHQLASPVAGTWIFNIDDLSLGIKFYSLISLAEGGVVVTSASLPTQAPFYGSWQATGPNSYKASFYTFVADANGVAVETSSVRLTLRLVGLNALTGTGVGFSCDLQGANCTQQGDNFQFTGNRILPN